MTPASTRKRVQKIAKLASKGRLAAATNEENDLAADFVRWCAKRADDPREIRDVAKEAVQAFDLTFDRYLADTELDDA